MAKEVKSRPIHWGVLAKNPNAIQLFYSELFGWKIDSRNPLAYGNIASRAVKAAISKTVDGSSRLIIYVPVTNIDLVLRRAKRLGGKTIVPRTTTASLAIAIFEDIEGNWFGLIEEDKEE